MCRQKENCDEKGNQNHIVVKVTDLSFVINTLPAAEYRLLRCIVVLNKIGSYIL
jgi:hypothetical protein